MPTSLCSIHHIIGTKLIITTYPAMITYNPSNRQQRTKLFMAHRRLLTLDEKYPLLRSNPSMNQCISQRFYYYEIHVQKELLTVDKRRRNIGLHSDRYQIVNSFTSQRERFSRIFRLGHPANNYALTTSPTKEPVVFGRSFLISPPYTPQY
jgi:hypothetical protein